MTKIIDNIKSIIKIYEEQRNIMPKTKKNGLMQKVEFLSSIITNYEIVLFDAYGVLNVGNDVINNAPKLLKEIKSQGKHFIILTNGSTYPTYKKLKKYKNWNFPIEDNEVISSRDALKKFLLLCKNEYWGVIGNKDSDIKELSIDGELIFNDHSNFQIFDGFIFLGAENWNENNQKKLIKSLKKSSRKILIANPDIVAPLGGSFSLEPGFWGWQIKKQTNSELIFFGKHHKAIFELALEKLARKIKSINLKKILMVGDSLHTDILGGLAFGIDTALLTSYGLFANDKYEKFIKNTKISPDFIVSKL